jgi:hypothetical protein
MRASRSSSTFLYGLIAGLVILTGVLGYALWDARQTETLTFQFGDERISVEAEGG